MSLRSGHGNGVGVPRIEVLPPDETLRGIAAHVPVPEPGERRPDGTFTPGSRTAQIQGGKARAGKTRLARRLQLGEVFADARFEPYARAARAFRREQCRQLAMAVGGGTCGVAPSSIVASAALQLAGSRFAFEVLGDMVLGSRLANDSRQNLLAAHELCAREATARHENEGDDLSRQRREFQARLLAGKDGPK